MCVCVCVCACVCVCVCVCVYVCVLQFWLLTERGALRQGKLYLHMGETKLEIREDDVISPEWQYNQVTKALSMVASSDDQSSVCV